MIIIIIKKSQINSWLNAHIRNNMQNVKMKKRGKMKNALKSLEMIIRLRRADSASCPKTRSRVSYSAGPGLKSPVLEL